MCPDCGHHTSAWVGGGCTVLRPTTVAEQAAGMPWVVGCGHDCTVTLWGESARDRLARALWGDAAPEPDRAPAQIDAQPRNARPAPPAHPEPSETN